MRIAVEMGSEYANPLFVSLVHKMGCPSFSESIITRLVQLGLPVPPSTRVVCYITENGWDGWDEARFAEDFDDFYQLEEL